LKTALITDAGHTVVEPGTTTCLGIGPDDEKKIDLVTGILKMM
ncbi:peptidyl-tRNA hydrolase, partial [Candidatus Woesearchaeota archaeon]|nr:peptidyl-tRNA hydrolase [Candidatus Woesearchaeota archaeon]